MRFPLCVLGLLCVVTLRAASVEELPTPERGIQPRAMTDTDGTLHLIWYRGEPVGGDIFYARQPKTGGWSATLRVNNEPKTAVSMGTIRGAQAVLGRSGTLHVVWDGARAKNDKDSRPPLYYTRLEAGKTSFESQRAMSGSWILDGGGAVAADHAGHVYVFWHGGNGTGEGNRRILVRTSSDDGRTFDAERAINPEGTGVCGCCAMQAIATENGGVYALYRTASDGGKNRDVALLASHDGGKTFTHRILDPWPVSACPMSSMSLAVTPRGVVGAWETMGQIHLGLVDSAIKSNFVSLPAGRTTPQKYPSLSVAPDGRMLLTWSEGAGWQKSGGLAWQFLDPEFRPQGSPTRGPASGISVWSFPCAVAKGEGFAIFH
jgi:hypothetical protein